MEKKPYKTETFTHRYTADHEEPKCIRCANMFGYDCDNQCGPKAGWNGYLRVETETVEYTKEEWEKHEAWLEQIRARIWRKK